MGTTQLVCIAKVEMIESYRSIMRCLWHMGVHGSVHSLNDGDPST